MTGIKSALCVKTRLGCVCDGRAVRLPQLLTASTTKLHCTHCSQPQAAIHLSSHTSSPQSHHTSFIPPNSHTPPHPAWICADIPRPRTALASHLLHPTHSMLTAHYLLTMHTGTCPQSQPRPQPSPTLAHTDTPATLPLHSCRHAHAHHEHLNLLRAQGGRIPHRRRPPRGMKPRHAARQLLLQQGTCPRRQLPAGPVRQQLRNRHTACYVPPVGAHRQQANGGQWGNKEIVT